MDPGTGTIAQAVAEPIPQDDASWRLRLWAGLLYAPAAGLICWGIALQYQIDRVVGADAYNYIISGLRGLALVVAGVGSAVAATGCAICAALRAAR